MSLYSRISRDDDDFFQQSRKIMFTVCFVVGLIAVLYTLYDVAYLVLFPITDANIVVTVGCFMVSFGLLFGYLYALKYRTAPDFVVEVWTFCNTFGFIIVMVSSRGMPYASVFFALALCTVIMQCPRYWLHFPWLFLGWVLCLYEQSFTLIGYPPLVVGGTTVYEFQDVFLRAGVCLFAMIAVMRAVHVQTVEFRRMLAASQTAVRMSYDVAEKLAAYDTTGATAVLEAYTSEAVADSSLVDTFRRITQNLEAYRAFIPQALLEGGNDNESVFELDAQGMDESAALLSVDETDAVQTMSSTEHKTGPNTLNSTNTDETMPANNTISSSLDMGSPPALPIDNQSHCSTPSTRSPISPRGTKMSFSRPAGDDPRVARLRMMGFKKFHVTLLGVCSVIQTHELSASEIHTRCQNLVTTSVSVMEQCEGVVMLMLADRVYASWNAFKPCQMHQLFAAKAAHILQSHFKDQGMTEARVAVATGRGLAGFVGTATMKSPVIFGEVVDHARLCLDYARQVNAPIIITD
eukprot:PhF_6_TR7975/c1_g1_i4/m.12159